MDDQKLRDVINDLIRDDNDSAAENFHSVLAAKMRERIVGRDETNSDEADPDDDESDPDKTDPADDDE